MPRGPAVRIGCVPNCTVCTSGLGLANVTVPPAVTVTAGRRPLADELTPGDGNRRRDDGRAALRVRVVDDGAGDRADSEEGGEADPLFHGATLRERRTKKQGFRSNVAP